MGQAPDILDTWKQDTLDKARRHPSKGYKLGQEQTQQFLAMAGHAPDGADFFGGSSETTRFALEGLRRRSLHEFEGMLDRYADQVRGAVLYGAEEAMSPLSVASMMYHATQDSEVNWRMIARTEMVRANNYGRIDAIKQMGYTQVWVPPHVGACAQCKKMLENQIFEADELRDKSNYGKPTRDWVPCIPLHPMCFVPTPRWRAVTAQR